MTCSSSFGATSRTDSPTIENHSGRAESTGRVRIRALSVCVLVFVTVNYACAPPEIPRFTLCPAAVTVKLGIATRLQSDVVGSDQEHTRAGEHGRHDQ